MSSGSVKASIPSTVRAMIQNIKEITGNHSEEDIYAMLKECSMDPNETTQKLLHQDTFHEVKRKKDRKKENLTNRDPLESRWRSGPPGRGARGNRVNFSSHTSNDAAGGKKFGHGKDYGINQFADKGTSSQSTSLETNREKSSSTGSLPVTVNGPRTVETRVIGVVESASTLNVGSTSSSNNSSLSGPESSSAVGFASDLVLDPSIDLRHPSDAGRVKGEVGSQYPASEPIAVKPSEHKSSGSEIGNPSILGKNLGKPQGLGKNHLPGSSQPSFASADGSSSISRPSSSYNSRPKQLSGPQRASSNKEWKPKPTSTTCQVIASTVVAGASVTSGADIGQKESASSEEANSIMKKKLEDFHLPQRQHVILPDHIYVPESEKTKFSFGSLGANFGRDMSHVNALESKKNCAPVSDTSHDAEEVVEVPTSNQNDPVTKEVEESPEHPQSPPEEPDNLSSSGDVEVSPSAIEEHNESKQENTLPAGGHQHSDLPNSTNYSLGYMPPILGTQLAQYENYESQARDGSRIPSFIVPQPFDLANYYAQFYCSGTDTDVRVAPFAASGANTKYNGNSSVLPTPSSHSLQEGGGLSAASVSPLVTQAAGLMQSSVAVTQQPVPVFRPPTGVHIPHYPANYIPYGHYISPFYVSPPIMHQFLGTGAFPQQPQGSTVYAPPPPATAAGIKYPLPQYKAGTNAGNPPHMVMQSAYGTYGSSSAGYNPSSAANAGNSTSSEDLGALQFKENKVYIRQQQNEGSAVWVTAPGREISNLPTSSFYNLPPQGQHVTFTPAQTGAFTGMYHPAQGVTAATIHPLLQQSQTISGAVDMPGPGGSIYQQPQHAQMNWPNNY